MADPEARDPEARDPEARDPEARRDRILKAAFDLREDLVAYGRSHLGNYAAAEDVVQETFLVVARKHEDFQEGTSMLAWCRSIARIEILRSKERYHRERSLVERVLDDAIDAAFEEFQESRSRHEKDFRKNALEMCVQGLSEPAQRVLNARVADDLGYPQIGKQLGMSIEAVRKALFRAKKRVRECVESKLRMAQ